MNRLQEILDLLADRSALTDEQIGELESELQDLFDELRAELNGDDADVVAITEALGSIADAVDALREEAATRIEAAEAEAAAAAKAEAERQRVIEELENRVKAPVAEETATEPPAEDDDPDGDDPDDDEEPAPEATQTEEREPVGAAAGTGERTPLSAIKPPKRFTPRPAEQQRPRVRIRAAAGGAELADRAAVELALIDAHRYSEGQSGRSRVAQFVAEFPKDRVLPAGRITDVTEMAEEVRARVSGPGEDLLALTADGGICAAPEVWYDLQNISQAGRPLRASLPGFNAARGGITFDDPLTLADIGTTGGSPDQAIGAMTAAQDAAGNVNKTYQVLDCGGSTTVTIEAVWRQLQFGNFQVRTGGERVSTFTDLSIAAFARFNEQRLWNKMLGLTKNVTSAAELGATRDFLTALNRGAINYRAKHRMLPNAPLEVRLPVWVGMGLLPDDQTKALQSYREQFEVTSADVEAWLGRRNIRVAAWYEDDFTTNVANNAALNEYPATFKVIMNHPGAWVYVDGGILDLGTIRDGDMVNDNVFRTFTEEFWNVGMWGVEAWNIEFTICANGASAGSIAPVACV